MHKGIDTAPTKKSAAAMLANKMLEFVCNSRIFHMAITTTMFKKMVRGETIDVVIDAM